MTAQTAQDRILHHAKAFAGEFHVDGENERAVSMAAHWLAREPMDGLDLNKGILLVGNVGTGKTLLMRAVRTAMSEIWGTSFGIKPCAELVREFADLGYDGTERWMTGKHICFDDFGTEGEALHFGKRTTLMAEVIEARYNRLTSGHKCWTHLTSNMGAGEIKKHYGERAYSRILHMCNVIIIGAAAGATDRRKKAQAPNPLGQQNADNLYTVIHPSVAKAMGEAVAPIVEKLKAERIAEPTRSTPTAEQMRVSFAEECMHLSIDNLVARRESYLSNYPMNTNGHSEAMAWVGIINAELKSRSTGVGAGQVPATTQGTPATRSTH
jgi:DNA replication protein DnaC